MPPAETPTIAGPLFEMIRGIREDVKDVRNDVRESKRVLDQLVERTAKIEGTLESQDTSLDSLQRSNGEVLGRLAALEKVSLDPSEATRLHDHVVSYEQRAPVGGCKVFHELVLKHVSTEAAAAKVVEKRSGKALVVAQTIGPYLALVVAIAALIVSIVYRPEQSQNQSFWMPPAAAATSSTANDATP